jgi:hypothetical protein
VIVDRRTLGHGVHDLNLTENPHSGGPWIIFQEAWKENSKDLPRRNGSILDDAPFRFNKRLYALDEAFDYVRSRAAE